MVAFGIASGLLAAFFQASAYFFSRNFLLRHGSPLRLLIASQLILGALSLLILPFSTPLAAFPFRHIGPLLLCSLAFLFGQFFFFQALRKIESSRIASIVGLKVVLVPLFLYFFFDSLFKLEQIAALLLALAAVMLMNYQGGGKFHWDGMGYCALALIGYSWSDIGVKKLVDSIGMVNTVHSALIAANFNNIFLALVMLPLAGQISRKTLRDAFPYAACWGVGVFFFFACFGYVGPAFGNIIQAMRGPLSLIMGLVLSQLGFLHLEARAPRAVWLRRGAAAGLMLLAIVVYAKA